MMMTMMVMIIASINNDDNRNNINNAYYAQTRLNVLLNVLPTEMMRVPLYPTVH